MSLLAYGDTGWGDELFFATLMTIAVATAAIFIGFCFQRRHIAFKSKSKTPLTTINWRKTLAHLVYKNDEISEISLMNVQKGTLPLIQTGSGF